MKVFIRSRYPLFTKMAHSTLRKDKSKNLSRGQMKTMKEKINESIEFEQQTSNMHHLKTRTHQLEAMIAIESKWLSHVKKHKLNYVLEEHLETIDKHFYEQGYMSLSLFVDFTIEQKITYMEFYLRRTYPKSLFSSNPPPKIWETEDKLALLTLRVYAIRYPNKILTTHWIKPYLLTRIEKQGLRERLWDCCTGTKESLSEALSFTIDSIKSCWNYVLSATMKFFSGQFLKLVAAIICAGLILKVMSKWAATKLFPYIFNNKPVKMEELGEEDGEGNVEKQQSFSDILETVGRTIQSVVEPAKTLDVPAFITEFGKYAGSLNNMDRLATNVWKYVKVMLDFIYAAGNGGIPYSDEGKLIHQVNTKINILEQYRGKPLTREKCIMLDEVRKEVDSMLTVEMKRIYPALMVINVNYLLRFKEMFSIIDSVLLTARSRVEPVWIHLVGDPGVGKTWVMNTIITALYRAMYSQTKHASELIYASGGDPKFFPHYRDHFAFVVDDFLQKGDPTERMIEAERMIHFSNTAFQPLPEAEAEKKGTTSFNSEVIFTTSNYAKMPLNYYPQNLKLTDNEALYRRFTMALFVERPEDRPEDAVENLMSYTFRPIISDRQLGDKFDIACVISTLVAKMMEKKREFTYKESLASNNTVGTILGLAGTKKHTETGHLYQQTKSRVDTNRVPDMEASLIKCTREGLNPEGKVEQQMDGGDDEDNKPPPLPRKGWDAAVKQTIKMMTMGKTDVANSLIAAYNNPPKMPEEKPFGSPSDRILGQLIERKTSILLAISAEEQGITYLREGEYTKHIDWNPVSWLERATMLLTTTHEDIELFMLKEPLKHKQIKRKFIYLCAGHINLYNETERTLETEGCGFVEQHPDKAGSTNVWDEYLVTECTIETKKAFLYDYKLSPESILQFHNFCTTTRLMSAKESLKTNSVYEEMIKKEPGLFATLVGETIASIALGKLRSRGDLPFLNWAVAAFDIRVLIFSNKVFGYRSEIYYSDFQATGKFTSPNGIDMAVKRFTSLAYAIPITPRTKMYKVTNFQETGMVFKMRSWFEGSKYIEETTEDFPKSCCPSQEKVQAGMVLFKDAKVVDFEKRRTHYGTWFAAIAMVGIATAVIVGLLAVLKSAVQKMGYNKGLLKQSFDPKGERFTKKTAKRLAKRAKVISTKTNVRTEGVVKQSKATNVMPKIQRNIEMLMFRGRSESFAYGFFVTPFEFATVSHVFTQDTIKEIEFCFSQTGTEGSVTLQARDFDVRIMEDRELAIVKVNARALPAHASVLKHLPSKKRVPEIIQEVIFVDHQESGHFLLRQGGEAKLDVAKFIVGGQADGVYSLALVTEKGDCGLPYMTNSDHVEHCLRGVHIGYGDGRAYFTPLYSEDFENTKGDVEMQSFMHAVGHKVEIKTDRIVPIAGFKSIGNMVFEGKPKVFYVGNNDPYVNTEIRLEKPTTKVPVKLKKGVDSKGVLQVPFANATKQYSLETRSYVTPKQFIKSQDFKGLGKLDFKDYRPFTYDEVINGVDFLKEISAMDVTTSSGPGLSDIGLTTEQAFPGPHGSRVMGPVISELVARMERHLQEEDTPLPTIGVANFKMELKPEEKAFTPRIYINSAKSSYVITKRYIGPIMAAMLKQDTDLAIGLDAFSMSWRDLYYRARGKSLRKMIADDVRKWDIHMRAHPFVEAFCLYLLECRMPAKYVKIVRQILEGALQSYVIMADQIYQMMGMPSGWFCTAWLNSIYNSVTTRALFRMANPDLDFDVYVFLKVLGDDNFMAVSDALEDERWNGRLYAKMRMEYLGIETTSIFKDGRGIPEFMPLESKSGEEDGVCLFLKRKFRMDKGLCLPTLELDTIKGIMTWVKPDKDRSLQVCVEENFTTALRELSFYPEETYNEYEECMRELCARKNYRMPVHDRQAYLLAYSLE